MELRIVLAAFVVLGSALAGRSLAGAARRRASTLKELCEGVRLLKIHMLSLLESTETALSGSPSGILRAVASGMNGGLSAGESWQTQKPGLRKRGGAADCLDETDLRLLDRLFSQLGVSGKEEQQALLQGAIQEFGERADTAREKSAQADRLYLTLSALIGLMLALIVI